MFSQSSEGRVIGPDASDMIEPLVEPDPQRKREAWPLPLHFPLKIAQGSVDARVPVGLRGANPSYPRAHGAGRDPEPFRDLELRHAGARACIAQASGEGRDHVASPMARARASSMSDDVPGRLSMPLRRSRSAMDGAGWVEGCGGITSCTGC